MLTLLKYVFGFCLIAASMVIGFFYFTPDLWRDITLRNSVMVPHSTARIDKASCKGLALVLKHCTITFHEDAAPYVSNVTKPQVAPPTQTLSYLFVGSPGERRVGLWRAVERPGSVVSDLGMEYLTNRIVTFIGMTLLSILILTCMAFYMVSVMFGRKDDSQPAESSVDEAIARQLQASAASPAWQASTSSARPDRPPARSGFGQRVPTR
jgi:hypothetical protein